MSDPLTLADKAPVGHVPLADPDFMTASCSGPDPLPADVILRLRLPCRMSQLTSILEACEQIANLSGKEARMMPRANYIEIFLCPRLQQPKTRK